MRTHLMVIVVGLAIGFASSALYTPPAQAAVSPVSQAPALAETRTSSELGLFLLLNGERARPAQADGGGLLLFTSDGGIASVVVPKNSVLYIENPGTNACHLCGANADGVWDGGCNTTVADVNYGSPIAASGGQRWISVRDTPDGGAVIKAVPASGSSTCALPVYFMQ